MIQKSKTHAVWVYVVLSFIMLVGISGCSSQVAPVPGGQPSSASGEVQSSPGVLTPTRTPFQSLPPTFTPVPPTPTSTPDLTYIYIDPALPGGLQERLALSPPYSLQSDAELAELRFIVSEERIISRWVYALAAPFPTLTDGVSADELHKAWRGRAAGPMGGQPLLMDEDTYRAWSAYWGEPGKDAIRIVEDSDLLESAWEQQPSWAILPFEKLEPRWKVLEIDGASPLHKDFSLDGDYPLVLPISLIGDQQQVDAIFAEYGPGGENRLIPAGNRDSERLTTLVMSGVTALVRATAFTMEREGLTHPAGDIGDLLRSADLTHISNEVPFAENCPFPNPKQTELRFCSDDRYIELLEDIGTDIVELTGDHFGDWGAEAMQHTLEMYRDRDWVYYGGGDTLEEGKSALLVEHNGNKLAFIGCNAKGGGYATARSDNPGAVACDFTYMETEIRRLRKEGYLPIATFQHFEYYTYQPQPNQIADSQRLADAGAVIVSGSQAHQPQAIEFYEGAMIHYGLGNLFFDQIYNTEDTARAFIDRHVFYAGRHISTELITILFVDYARPRLMTAEEREQLLLKTFTASGW